jgi:predicted acyltransferase
MAGLDFVIFAGFLWLIDGKGYQRYARPLMIMGMNAIAVYMASELVEEILGATHVHDWIYKTVFAAAMSPKNASLGYAVAYTLVMYALAHVMYKRKWFLKV